MAPTERPVDRDRLIGLDDAALLAECDTDRFRGTGAGGQKRNKTSSSVRVRHRATGIAGTSGESRSQPENRAIALRRLRERFAFELRAPVELDAYVAPAPLALLAGPVVRSDKFQRGAPYLRAVGHLLDLYAALACSLADAADRLGLSTGALARWVDADPRLARRVAELRDAWRASAHR
jgi:hypothetical protein